MEDYYHRHSIWYEKKPRHHSLIMRLGIPAVLIIVLILSWFLIPTSSVRSAGYPLEKAQPILKSLPNPCYLDDVVCLYEQPEIIEEFEATVYGYSSTVDQTDSSPEITASGRRVHSGTVANNCLPFGTKVLIENREYVIEDRMNVRYGCNMFDIWFPTKEAAKQWGKRKIKIQVLE